MGRFDKTDADYAVDLKLAASPNVDEAIEELRAEARRNHVPCRHTTMGWTCELPMCHSGPHQKLSCTATHTGMQIVDAQHWGNDGAPTLDVKCHGQECVFPYGPIYSRRQNSAYEDDASNYTMPVCDRCFEEIQKLWAEQWAEYQAQVL